MKVYRGYFIFEVLQFKHFLYHFSMRYIPYPLKTNKFSFYFMLNDDERMELFSVFVPVHMRTNLCECPIQTQFVRHIGKLQQEK